MTQADVVPLAVGFCPPLREPGPGRDFAERMGTSRSRLSTYMSGKVVPSAALMVRMRRVALQASGTAAQA